MNKQEKIELLAREVVGSWDMDDLISFATEQMEMFYMENEEEFEEDFAMSDLNEAGE